MLIELKDKFANRSAVILPVFDGKKAYIADLSLSKEDREYLNKVLASFEGETVKSIILPEGRNFEKVILLGLGDESKWTLKKFSYSIRRVINFAKTEKLEYVSFRLADFSVSHNEGELVKITATNLLMADFTFNKYKETPKGGWPKIKTITIVVKSPTRLNKFLEEGIILGEETNDCRDLANTPGSDMTPKLLADYSIKKGKENNFKVKVLEETEIKKLGMGGVIGVSQGSTEKPRFIIAEYWGGSKNQNPIVLVGKGVTFDSGGLNIKPTGHIYEMHMDMSGGSAVIHAISAIARMKLRVNVVALVPAVENMPSGSSYRPGDVLKTITGKTIEVLNTDAEGRIILADGLGYAQKYKPELMIDVATLTGGAAVALGQRAIALFTNKEELEKVFRDIGENIAEPVWPLPVWDEYLEDIKSTFGDVANDGKNKYGSAIQGAIFLKQFIGDYPWVHLDIAPTMTAIDGQQLSKGASGTSVRLLYEVAKVYAK